ncbi:MAG: pyridoxal phosphate-dependent aminotransferase [Candidatus Limnocylindrales bacterium]
MSASRVAASVDGRHQAAGYQWEESDAQIAAAYQLHPEQVIRFDTNTSPRRPPWLPGAVGAAPIERINEYPDATYAELTEAIAAREAVEPSAIVVGAGADEILDLVAKAWLRPGSRAVVAPPTYAMYAILSRQRGAAVVEVARGPAEAEFGLDHDALVRAAAGAALVWLCDPNNPTGTTERPDALPGLLQRLAALPEGGPAVVVDEAYRDFAGQSMIGLVAAFPRLVVVRTLSKAHGLAGIRVGYALADPPHAARLARVRPPGSVSVLSAWIATRALRDPNFAPANVAAIRAERQRLRDALATAGWGVPDSVTNFLLLDAGGAAGADAAAERLLRSGLVPRRFAGGPLRGFLRLTVRTPDQDDLLVRALGEKPAPRAGSGRQARRERAREAGR